MQAYRVKTAPAGALSYSHWAPAETPHNLIQLQNQTEYITASSFRLKLTVHLHGQH